MHKKKIMIIGAGGHGRVVADIAKLNGYSDICFLDDKLENNFCKISGTISDFNKFKDDHVFFVAIGNNAVRKKIIQKLFLYNIDLCSLIHPKAVISDSVKIGRGVAVMAGVVVNSNAHIGDGVILNTCSSVDHDCIVGDYSHIAVGARIAGTVHIGENVFVGAGATVINNLNITDNCIIGAGATVVSDLNKEGIYVGIPAKILK